MSFNRSLKVAKLGAVVTKKHQKAIAKVSLFVLFTL